MAADLDRAYLINGDDLRIALGASPWTFNPDCDGGEGIGPLALPEDVARVILDEIAKPLDASRWPMTRGELETRLSLALTAVKVVIEPAIELFTLQGTPIHSFRYPVKNPDRVAAELLDDIETQGVDDPDAELVYEVGRPVPLPMPPDAPEPPLEDPELIAAQQVLDALAPLEAADPAAVLRLLRWLRERFDL